MRHFYLQLTLAILFCMVVNKTFGYDIAVENEDGVILYYNYINDGTELEVTYEYFSNNRDEYVGTKAEIINIPDTVLYYNRKRAVTRIGDYSFSYGDNPKRVSEYNKSTKIVTIPNTSDIMPNGSSGSFSS